MSLEYPQLMKYSDPGFWDLYARSVRQTALGLCWSTTGEERQGIQTKVSF